jgi:peptidoglycan/LPS O-acetylase OafA/YrhL
MTAVTAPADAQAPVVRPAAPVRGHLGQIDVVRVLTFACVVAVHALSSTVEPTNSAGGAVLMLLHFTREVFFVVTGFVLVHTYGRRPHLDVASFWRRRFLLVGVPYVVWSLVYYLVNVRIAPQEGQWWRELGFDLITGRASYQLYFLLVSLQAYLLLPLLLRLLRRTAGRHRWLLAGSLVVQLVVLQLIQTTRGAPRWAEVILTHADVMFPTYQLFLLVGALLAWHLPRIQPRLEAHRRWIGWAVVGGAGIAELAFWLQQRSDGTVVARGQLQPAMVPWSIAVFLGLYALGLRWASRPRTGAAARALTVASRASFGIYLVHPLVLDVLLGHGFAAGPGQSLNPVLATIAVATVVVVLLQRTPLSVPLTGREPTGRATWRWAVAALAALVLVVGAAGHTERIPATPAPITTT